jgi:hypothetical protein
LGYSQCNAGTVFMCKWTKEIYENKQMSKVIY